MTLIAFLSERRPLEVLEQKDSENTHDPLYTMSSDWQQQQQQLQHLEAGQEMTQFDICPANQFEPTSTPYAGHKGAGDWFDIAAFLTILR